MIASPQQNYLTAEEYLQLEEQSDIKHEYIDGYIYAMAGALDPHVTIAGNLFALLRNHVRGSGCRVYIADMKARIESLNRFYYPDVMVTCERRDRETPGYKRFPALLNQGMIPVGWASRPLRNTRDGQDAHPTKLAKSSRKYATPDFPV